MKRRIRAVLVLIGIGLLDLLFLLALTRLVLEKTV